MKALPRWEPYDRVRQLTRLAISFEWRTKRCERGSIDCTDADLDCHQPADKGKYMKHQLVVRRLAGISPTGQRQFGRARHMCVESQ